MSATLATALAALAGLVLGSFLNVVAHRVPRRMSLSRPASTCPACGRPIRPLDNVPVISWVLLRGRCRDCRVPISARYPLVEALTAVLFAAVVAVRYGDRAATALGLIVVGVVVPLALIDLDVRLLPNRIVGPAAVVAVVAGTALDPGGELERLVSGAIGAGVFLAIALAYPGGIGLGDVKLVGVLGLLLGREAAVAVLGALLSGLAVGVAIMAKRGVAVGRKTAVPFGPFLAFGGVVGVLVGPELLDAYLNGFRG